MIKYVGIKSVNARPATYGEFLEAHPESVPAVIKIDLATPGFIVKYKDGYTSWSPEGPFNEAYTPLLGGFDVDELTVEKLIERIEWTGFECEGGPLKKNLDFIQLKKLLGVK